MLLPIDAYERHDGSGAAVSDTSTSRTMSGSNSLSVTSYWLSPLSWSLPTTSPASAVYGNNLHVPCLAHLGTQCSS
ncbi:hypothetical protein DPMN_011325 [Dreissena polymorpha]|uniref:Uncharacterized protein n=1 Tax=Dreissena polymorpha TaxID=45954 RepID=A0A9D4S1R3_DREPO|nr:hypothetical protein DPMN_011325 [Dreissena polymorpha]